jgi:hypothetical protein
VSSVYVTTYEIVGDGLEIAERHYAAVDAAIQAHWDWAESIGGSGIRPAHDGGLRSVFFDSELPKGWRAIGSSKGKTEAVPRRGTKTGKEAEAAMNALPRAPRPADLAAALGYNPSEMAIDSERGTIYFPTELRVSHPAPRIFVRLPRFAKDGFTPDESKLLAVAESELMRAIEDHNAEAKRVREKEAA